MTAVASGLASALAEAQDSTLTQKAKELTAKVLLPKNITPQTVEKYFRKALRIKAWHHLNQIQKGILYLTRKLTQIKSPTLKETLKQIFTEIELHTLKGKALYYGILILQKDLTLKHTLKISNIIKQATTLLAIGISYLNNPPILRIYG